jgi:large subunit ribosomal protein L9
MQVLLLKDVEPLGEAGEVKKVADGYARNYLIPRGLATAATAGAVKQAELMQQAEERREAQAISEAKALAAILDGQTVSFQARAGEGDRLYGSITSGNIAEALEENTGQEVDKRKIELSEPIKDLGEHTVTIRLAAEAVASVTVVVERQE